MPATIRRVRPTPTDAYLGNPHKGCCTFQHFNGDTLFPGTTWSEEGPTTFPPATQKVAPGYLPSTVAYCRWFWSLMEPEKGQYDFSVIDQSLKTCEERGQTLAVRLMAFGSARQPQVPEWYARQYPMQTYKPHGDSHIQAPVHDSPEYLEHWGGFVREFARRYDGSPLLESIDVTYIGPWGEGAGECSAEQCRRFAALWKEAFPNTPRLALIAGDQMRESTALGSGWRCDCYGDMGGWGDTRMATYLTWNHMFDCYPEAVVQSGAQEAWRSGPVHFESCWVPMHWYQQQWDIDFILEQGLKYHGTYFMPKYTALPEAWMDRLAAFCRRLGYRFVFRQAVLAGQAAHDGEFTFQAWVENVGVAPIYRRYDLALRFRQGDREAVVSFSDVDIRQWMPGDAWVDQKVHVPEGFRPGSAELAVGLVAPATSKPRVRFAARESFVDGWLDLGGIELT